MATQVVNVAGTPGFEELLVVYSDVSPFPVSEIRVYNVSGRARPLYVFFQGVSQKIPAGQVPGMFWTTDANGVTVNWVPDTTGTQAAPLSIPISGQHMATGGDFPGGVSLGSWAASFG